MQTLFISHPDCEQHAMQPTHPESPLRLQAIHTAVDKTDWQGSLQQQQAQPINEALFRGIHPDHYVKQLDELAPQEGFAAIDGDTSMNPFSLRAAKLAAGATIAATEAVMSGRAGNAFCAIRPPGHHAESSIAMGFCLFNNIALAAERALSLGAERVAIVDFDVHHGNGTVEIFLDRPEVLVCSSFQYPFYPGRFDTVDASHICLTPLPATTAGPAFRQAVEQQWTQAIAAHQPDLILVSAGFDAHAEDPLGGLLLEDDDYLWVTQLLTDLARRHCGGKLVSALEGGYHLDALARSTIAHLKGLTSP